jgi:hypothetical protein
VTALARTRYAGFNHTYLAEIMAEKEGVALSRSTLLLGGIRLKQSHRRRQHVAMSVAERNRHDRT